MKKECIAQTELGFSYSVFGLHLRSSCPLPGIPSVDLPTDQFDVVLHMGSLPNSGEANRLQAEELVYVCPETNAAGVPFSQISKVENGAYLRLAYEDGTQFWLDRHRENIWSTWPAELSLENAATYLFGPVLGILLRLRGVACLHASAISIGDHSVAFVGPPGAGKSTTAAAFARQGYGVISDDIVALSEREGAFFVLPAYPFLCLRPESVKMLYESPEALPLFVSDWDKRRLELGDCGARFESRELPLGAIYVLDDPRPSPQPAIEMVPPQGALLSLLIETYANRVVDREMRAREFSVLGQLAASVPVRRIHRNDEASGLTELCKAIRNDYDALEVTKAGRCSAD